MDGMLQGGRGQGEEAGTDFALLIPAIIVGLLLGRFFHHKTKKGKTNEKNTKFVTYS
jgi:hypothetical protein